jgi:hypothetical protein
MGLFPTYNDGHHMTNPGGAPATHRAGAKTRFAGDQVFGCFGGPTQLPLAAHFTTGFGGALVDAGNRGATPVDTGEVDKAVAGAVFGFDTAGIVGCTGPPIVFGLAGPGPPMTIGFLGPPTAVCAAAGLQNALAQRKMTDIVAPFFISCLSLVPAIKLHPAILQRLTMACTKCHFPRAATG